MTRRPLLVLLLLAGCSKPAVTPADDPAPYTPLPDEPGTRVLFVGNSHTRLNHLPEVVAAMAEAGGRRVLHRKILRNATGLRDHLDGGAAKVLSQDRWDFVVLQQGASSLPESRADLKASAGEWGKLIRERAAKPALFMVWPPQGQANGFALVSRSYREGAESAGGVVFPAGEAWEEALKADPALPLYASDGSHAAPAGTYLAALVVTHGLVGVRPDSIPSKLALGKFGDIDIPDGVAAKLRTAAAAVIDRPAK